MEWELTFTGPGHKARFIDPVSDREWSIGDTLIVDEETKERLVDNGPKGHHQPAWKAEPVGGSEDSSDDKTEQSTGAGENKPTFMGGV